MVVGRDVKKKSYHSNEIFCRLRVSAEVPDKFPGPHPRLLRLHDEYCEIFPASGAEIADEFPAMSRLGPRSAPGTQEPGLQLTNA